MFGAMTSLTGGGGLQGGSAGPSTATSTSNTTNNSGFNGGSINFGSNNGMPSWMIAVLALGAFYVYNKA
ncbi:hypothetical protein CWN94_11675 [Vibrio splendidus]|uniref:hypothetical protein n=1 Tax=Vibrio TaxID=662 RepID=UPI000C83494D|nr:MULTISPECIES: hypothetical protein [Vibrio]PMH28436.1 hypothetical protein BCU71_07690 [Vibrio lentus]PMK70417.1 hypothetical protein BCT93_07325 [Vibrio lentus]PTO54056.1 hypothetical protein CWN94_11675 [Vibrio splendidus]